MNPKITKITEDMWGKMDTPQTEQLEWHRHDIQTELQYIRKEENLTKLRQKYPQIEAWLTQDYADKEVKTAIVGLKITTHAESMEFQGENIKQHADT